MVIDKLDESNFFLYAAKHYTNPYCYDTLEFYDDLNRFKYLKRLFSRYQESGELKERLILNHIIVLYNIFGVEPATRMLFLKLYEFHKYLKGVEKEHIGAAHLEKILGGTWKQTSYNGNFRKNYAGIGYSFDEQRNAFIPPKPFNSWVLIEETCQWKAPVDMPTDGQMYSWNEDSGSWVSVT